jgi:hypothetical protein
VIHGGWPASATRRTFRTAIRPGAGASTPTAETQEQLVPPAHAASGTLPQFERRGDKAVPRRPQSTYGEHSRLSLSSSGPGRRVVVCGARLRVACFPSLSRGRLRESPYGAQR